MKFLNIGFGNMISEDKILAIVDADSAPIKRMISEAKSQGKLIDATYGRKTKAVIISDSEHIILSAMSLKALTDRAAGESEDADEER